MIFMGLALVHFWKYWLLSRNSLRRLRSYYPAKILKLWIFPLCTLEKFKVLEFLLEKRSVISLVYCMPFKFHIIDTWKNHKPSMELWFCSVYNVKAAPYLVPNHCTVINFLWVCCFPFCGCYVSLFSCRNNCKIIIAFMLHKFTRNILSAHWKFWLISVQSRGNS